MKFFTRQISAWIRILSIFGIAFLSEGQAGTVNTTTSAAFKGTYGLRVSAGSQCTADSFLKVSGQTYSTSQTIESCERLEIENSVVTSGAHINASSGHEVRLGSGFTVDLGSSFAVDTDPNLVRGGFATNQSPNSEPHYAIRFYLNADNLSLSSADSAVIFAALSTDAKRWFELKAKFDSSAGENRLFVTALEDSGSVVTTEGAGEVALPIGWNYIELELIASEAGQANGKLSFLLNGSSQTGISDLDNETAGIDLARWGLQEASDSVSGSIDLDEFDSRRAGVIGPTP